MEVKKFEHFLKTEQQMERWFLKMDAMYLRITDVQMFRYYRVVFLFPVLDVSEFSAKTSDFVFTSVSRDPVLCPFCH